MARHKSFKEGIRIGTIVKAGRHTAEYIRQILPHGFESFSITFGRSARGIDLKRLAAQIHEVIADTDVVISSIGVYGNPLMKRRQDEETLQSWKTLIDHAHLFGCNIVSGFTGRLKGEPIDKSIPAFRKVFGPLARRARDRKVKIAFENCDMGGSWDTGDWNIAHGPRAWELMFDAVPADNLGLQWEPCHQMVSLVDPIPQLRAWVKKIFHLHGKDATVCWDVIWKHGVHGPEQFAYHRTPGFGDSNWADIVTILRQGGFRGAIDIEGWHDPVYRDDLEMTGQVRALQYLKACRGGTFVPNPT